MDKVRGGTPRGLESMCTTCRSAHRIIGLNLQTVVFCRATAKGDRVTFPVSECSLYDDKRVPSLYDMQTIAWEVKSRNRGQAGFAGDGGMDIIVTPPDPYKNQQPQQAPVVSRGTPESESK